MTRNLLSSVLVVLTLLSVGLANSALGESGQPIQVGESFTLHSTILDQERLFNVYLPPGYETSGERYPVLYLLDGGVREDFLHILGIASLAAEFRKIRPFVVVGIEGIDRYHDLIHLSSVAADKTRLPTSGGSPKFRRFLAEELKPAVEKRFRLTDETVLIGESAAGLFVVETLLRTPDLFSGYIAVSPMMWWEEQSLARTAGTLLQKDGFPADRRVYLTIADEGGAMREGVDKLVQAFEKHAPKGLSWAFKPMEHETHGTIFHPAALDALRSFFASE